MTRTMMMLALCLSSLGCGDTRTIAPTGEPLDREPTPEEWGAIRATMARAGEVRSRRFTRPFEVRVLDARGMRARYAAEFDHAHMSRLERLYRGLSLTTPEADIETHYEGAAEYDILGAFSVATDTMLLLESSLPSLTATTNATMRERLVVLHELVHALQRDPSFPTETSDPNHTLSWDEVRVRNAIVEGDAMFAMIVAYARSVGVSPVRLARSPMTVAAFARFDPSPIDETYATELRATPAVLRFERDSPYTHGTAYVASVYAEGGWPAVDALHANPPASMEEVMHIGREGILSVPERATQAVHDLFEDAMSGAAYEHALGDDLGELGLLAFFDGVSGPTTMSEAADGWSGDFACVYAREGAPDAAIWVSAWDSIRDAVEAFEAARQVANRLTAAGRRVRVERVQRALLITFDVPEDLDEDLHQALTDYVFVHLAGPAAPEEEE